jgi:glycosyltransferase involved in cell wall biosynthesis
MTTDAIGLTPDVRGVGGMVSFRRKLTAGLQARGFRVSNDPADPGLAALLVIGGTRDLAGLRRARRRGVQVVQRLDGINWIHRRRRTGLRHFFRAETGNWILRTIRDRYADGIVYQSAFAKDWWERAYGPANRPDTIIHNAVDLAVYQPDGPGQRPADFFRLLLVEGSLQGGYETGLASAVELCQRIDNILTQNMVKLAVAGQAPSELRSRHDKVLTEIEWLGLVAPEKIPELDRSAHLLFSADLNPACPNAVIEALACGLPVAAFDTGALRELVGEQAGAVVPYGGDPWRLDPPDIDGLARAAIPVLENQPPFRAAARRRAETLFDLDRMVERYLDALLGTTP